jgi:hypothetical protein
MRSARQAGGQIQRRTLFLRVRRGRRTMLRFSRHSAQLLNVRRMWRYPDDRCN